MSVLEMAEEDFNFDVPFDRSDSVISGPPPRKRRRPALSCEQCRKRKIKCDRTYPCNHCTQSKTAVCSYSSDNVVAHALQESSAGHNTVIPTRKKNPSSIASTHHSSDATSPKTSIFSDRTTNQSSPHSDTDVDDASSRKALLDRIRTLEEKLAESTKENSHDLDEGDSVNLFHPNRKLGQHFTYEQKGMRGTVSKTRFFGQSHFMYSYGAFDRIACMNVNANSNTHEFGSAMINSDVPELMSKCKAMARAAKAAPHKQWLLNPNFRESIPQREMADKLVNLYFRTSETIHRILHIPSFQREYLEYWDDPSAASTVFVLKLILVMSIGACFYQGPDVVFYHNLALQWIFAAQSWLSSPFEKARLHMSGVQIHCLLLFARINNSVCGDLIWISAGALLRIAFQMGYHRDPKHLPRMSQWHAEMRRRLWATIIELNTQSALDSGMPPLFSVEDFDTEAPANIDDVDLDENINEPVVSRPPDVFTQTSLQLMMVSSIRPRLEIVRHENSVRYEPSYDEALALGTELTKICKNNNNFITRVNAASPLTPQVSQLSRNLLDIFTRRFLMALHRPFAAKAQKEPRYYFSRKACVDCALTLLSYPSVDPSSGLSAEIAEPGYKDDYTWLKTMNGGFQKGSIVHAALIIFTELMTQIEEDPGVTSQGLAAREPLKQGLRGIISLAAERVKVLENNVKGHLFISIVLAQVEATEAGQNVEEAVMNAARNSLVTCLELLSNRIKKSLSEAEYMKIIEATTPSATGASTLRDEDWVGMSRDRSRSRSVQQEFGQDFGMQDWNVDFNLETNPDVWFTSHWEDNRFLTL